jgi:nucleoside triphosphatase
VLLKNRGTKGLTEQQYPIPSVAALIFNSEGKLLLVKSHKWKGKYVIPGGRIEVGERMEDALRREIREETGLQIHDIKFICYHEVIFDEGFWEKMHFISFDFCCKTRSTEVCLNEEAEEHIWISIDQALQLPILPYLKKSIEAYKRLEYDVSGKRSW